MPDTLREAHSRECTHPPKAFVRRLLFFRHKMIPIPSWVNRITPAIEHLTTASLQTCGNHYHSCLIIKPPGENAHVRRIESPSTRRTLQRPHALDNTPPPLANTRLSRCTTSKPATVEGPSFELSQRRKDEDHSRRPFYPGRPKATCAANACPWHAAGAS